MDTNEEVRSTKRPTSSTAQRPSKRQKKETQEDVLLQKAIACMENAGGIDRHRRDNDDIFGEYVATEIRSIQDSKVKCWVKFQIQPLLFSAQSGAIPSPQLHALPPIPPSRPGTSQAMLGQWDYPNTTPMHQWSNAFTPQWNTTPSPINQWNTTPMHTPSSTPSLNDEYGD